MARYVVIDYAAIVHMWANGLSVNEIASEMGCCRATVRRALAAAGFQPSRRRKAAESPVKVGKRMPIYPEEISRYRDRLKIGSIVTLMEDEKKRCPEGGQYVVAAKFPAFFIAVRGQHERHELYVDMIISERNKMFQS